MLDISLIYFILFIIVSKLYNYITKLSEEFSEEKIDKLEQKILLPLDS